MKTRTTLYADEGMILTDGQHFGEIVHLSVDTETSAWYEITNEEYHEILQQQLPPQI